MKILILNGSPRHGNTRFALATMEKLVKEKYQDVDCEFIDVSTLKIHGCISCNLCKSNGGNCIHKDDTVEYMNKIVDADILIFGTPVYWWGVSGQLKTFIDKFYSKATIIKEKPSKKVGVVAVGASDLSDIQYKLITDQFKSICDFLKWELIFSEGFSASEKDDIKNDIGQTKEIAQLVDKI